MKIITWNCKMKFREDCSDIFPLKPDILVVPECENLDKARFPEISDFHWIGENQSKGLGLFAFNDFKIELYKNYSENQKYILPVTISRKNESYRVMGVWTKKAESGHLHYISQFKLALSEYDSFLDYDNLIICGDFNSNLIWKRTGVDKVHQEVLDHLSNKNIYSSYHHFFKEEQGKESIPTYYHYHQRERPFHIDFCFLSRPLLNKLRNVELGDFDKWMGLSDHVPMIIEF